MKRRSSERRERQEDYLEKDPDKFEVKFVNSRVGFGLFSKQNFRVGDFLLYYRGKKCPESTVSEINNYMFYVPTQKMYVDGSDPEHGGIARFINDDANHPNARAVPQRLQNGEVVIVLKCKSFIAKGDEVRYDYCHGSDGSSCPWRYLRFDGKILQCDISQSQKFSSVRMSSETKVINEHLRETFCQASETASEEDSDAYITDPLYTSASQVTLGTLDTDESCHKKSTFLRPHLNPKVPRSSISKISTHSKKSVSSGIVNTVPETASVGQLKQGSTQGLGKKLPGCSTSKTDLGASNSEIIINKIAKTCDNKGVDSDSDYLPADSDVDSDVDSVVDSDSTISNLPRGKKRSKKIRSHKVEEVVTDGGASTSKCAIDYNERNDSKNLDLDNNFLDGKERSSQEFVSLDQQAEPEHVTDVLTCATCSCKFDNQYDTVKHFLLQQCTRKFIYIDPFHIPALCCLICKSVFFSTNLMVFRTHLKKHDVLPQIMTDEREGNYAEMTFSCDVVREIIDNYSIKEPSSADEEEKREIQCSKNAGSSKLVPAKSESTNPRKSPYSIECQLCKKVLQTHLCLPKHLRKFHQSSNDKFINAIVKLHYFEKKKKGTTKCIYICLHEGCYKIFHRKDKHQIVDHQQDIRSIRKVTDLPSYILGEAGVQTRDELDHQLENLRGFNFTEFLKKWKQEKEIDYDEGKGARRYAADRLPGLLKKIKIFLIMTDGLSDATVVSTYFLKLKTEMKVKAGQSQAQICRELKDFIDFCRLGCSVNVPGFTLKCEQCLRSLQRQISKANKEVPCRIAANHEFMEATFATVEEIDEVFRIISSFLYKTLYFFENLAAGCYTAWENKKYNGTKYTKLYKLLQCSLLFLICCRNVTRISSALYVRKEYLESLKFSSKKRVYTFKCIDESVLKKMKSEKKAGIRELRDQLTVEIKNTNKNARTEGIKCLALSETELFCFVRYLRLKEKFGVGHQSLLFLMLDQESEKIRRNVMGKWNRYLESFLKLPIAINTNAWRKNLCTLFSKEVGDLESERSLDRHIGHSRKVAQIHYEIIQKENDAINVSEAVDRVIKVCKEGPQEFNLAVVSNQFFPVNISNFVI